MPLISDSIGRVLGKRYRLVSALGTGASAHVFLAQDVSLRRRVAVKVLLPSLSQDPAFLKRFSAEARSVAALNHPHVLQVYDWGEDVDGPYLVLEYLHGGTLRDVLDRGFQLSPAQAARLGAQAAQGLAYAHARGLVHRDVKPANLLFDEEGRVRIADFGVARALAEAAWTEPAGAMVGTARYASPEQAQGQRVDGRADVYSLALVLYEALTGEVPFVADTTMGTLMARVGAPLPRHPALGPLDDVLARAAAPEPGSRLDAAGLAARLEAIGSALPTPRPLPLRPPETGAGAPDGDLTLAPGAAQVFDIDALERAQVPPEPPASPRVGPRRRRWSWVAAGLVVVVVAAGVALAVRQHVFTPSHPVPKLTGQTLARDRRSIGADHFTLVVQPAAYSVTTPAGEVLSQDPAPGVTRSQGTTVRVVPSKGPPPEPVPSLAGLDCATATAKLQAAHFKVTCPALLAYSTTVKAGTVINWSYDGRVDAPSAPYGSTVGVAISRGKPPVPVPAVSGDTSFTQAKQALGAVGLGAVQATETSTTVPAGQPIGTSPATGVAATVGTTVTVYVSTGPPVVTVPNVTGDSVPTATAAMQKAGLVVSNVYGPPGGHVFTTNPAAGQQVKKGSSVNLYTQ
ncbi:MAG: protein kinase domain-containing protein [Acidimicrobiales bacterium]